MGTILVAAAACGIGGCISGGPELSAGRGVQSGGQVVIPIAAANKTENPMPLRRVDYTVSVDGGAPIVVTRSALATVHSLSTQMLELPVPAGPGARTYTISGEVIYVPARKFWKVMYDEEIHRPGVSFSFSGEIDQAAAVITEPEIKPSNTPALDDAAKKNDTNVTEPVK